MSIPVVKEHERVRSENPETQEHLIALAKRTTDQAKADRVLGLHLKPGESDPSAWWFVGQVWVKLGDDPYVLRVEPKIHNLASVLMYAECMTHPLVRAHLDDCMYFYWDEPPIPVEKRDHPITPLVVMRYLCLLHELCQKHLRLMITPVEANLTARIRGKLRRLRFFGQWDKLKADRSKEA